MNFSINQKVYIFITADIRFKNILFLLFTFAISSFGLCFAAKNPTISINLIDEVQEFTTVTGTISSIDTPGQSIEGITVSIYNESGELAGNSITNTTGAYSIGNDDIETGIYSFQIAFDPIGTSFYHDAVYENVNIEMNNTYDFGVFEILAPANFTGYGKNRSIELTWDIPANSIEVTSELIERLQSRVAVSKGEKLSYYSSQLEYCEKLLETQLNGTDDLGDISGYLIVNDNFEVVATTDADTFSHSVENLINGLEYQFAIAANYGYGEEFLVYSDFITVEPTEITYLYQEVNYQWFDVRNNENSVALGSNDEGETWIDFINPFLFYGAEYDGITVGANGALSFEGLVNIPFSNQILPDTLHPNAIIAPFWTDLNPSAGPQYDVFYTIDNLENLWIEWFTPYYGSNEVVNFECKLEFDTGKILFQYNNADSWDISATTGLENESGDLASSFEIVNNLNHTSVEFEYVQLEYGNIEGYVVNDENIALEECEIYHNGDLLAVTDPNGFYSSAALSGNIELEYLHPEFCPVGIFTTIEPDQQNVIDTVIIPSINGIEGFVVDSYGIRIPDVSIYLEDLLLATTNDTGYYNIELCLPVFEYAFNFEHPGYWPEWIEAWLLPGEILALDDVVLTRPEGFELSHNYIEFIVDITEENPSYSGSEILDFSNNHFGRIEWSVNIQFLSFPDHWEYPISSQKKRDTNNIEDIHSLGKNNDVSPLGPVRGEWNYTDDVWDYIDSWVTNETVGGVGAIVTNDRVYTSEWGQNDLFRFFEYDYEGNLIRSETFPTELQGVRDMAWDGTWLYGGNANDDGTIYRFNPDDLYDFELLGTAPGLGRGIALDFDTGDIYTSNWSCLGKLEYNFPGEYSFVELTFPTRAASCYGCAWMPEDPDDYNLWLFCQPASNGVVFRVDPENTINSDLGYEVYASDQGTAGGIDIFNGYDPTMWTIATNMQSTTDRIDLWEGYLHPFFGDDWLYTFPQDGIVYPGEVDQITVGYNVEEHLILDWAEDGDEVEAQLVFTGPIWDGGTIPIFVFFIDGFKDDTNELPSEYKLHQNYPNPFNPATTIRFDLVDNQYVNISIFNILGQCVEQLVNKDYDAGFHSVLFDASKLSSGIYFYSIKTDAFTSLKKMILIR